MAKRKAAPIDPGQSPRHVWKVAYQTKTPPIVCVERCDRCERFYHPLTDGWHGPIHCYPTPAWMAAHPTDDGKER